jgi:hypothetical protein
MQAIDLVWKTPGEAGLTLVLAHRRTYIAPLG